MLDLRRRSEQLRRKLRDIVSHGSERLGVVRRQQSIVDPQDDLVGPKLQSAESLVFLQPRTRLQRRGEHRPQPLDKTPRERLLAPIAQPRPTFMSIEVEVRL